MEAEERQLATAGASGHEDVRAEELCEADGACEDAPDGEAHDERLEVEPIAHDQHERRRQERVLEELRGGDRMGRRRVPRRPVGDQDLEPDPDEVDADRDPKGQTAE